MKAKNEPIFSLEVFERIRETIGKLPPESGGMICGDPKTNLVTYFYFDVRAKCTAGGYSPDTATLEGLLKKIEAEGLEMMGFPHSHPPGFDLPSSGDRFYARRIFAANPKIPRLIIPIISSDATGHPFQMRVFVATARGDEVEIRRVPLRIVEMDELILNIVPSEVPTAEEEMSTSRELQYEFTF